MIRPLAFSPSIREVSEERSPSSKGDSHMRSADSKGRTRWNPLTRDITYPHGGAAARGAGVSLTGAFAAGPAPINAHQTVPPATAAST